jgi:replicative DNA helicase
MKTTEVDLSPERLIVTYMIVSERFLKEIAPVFRKNLMKASYARVVADWVLDYWYHFKDAPGRNIQEIWKSKKAVMENENQEEIDTIAEFLKRLSAEWEKSQPNNIEYAIQQAIHYLKIRSQELLIEQLQNSIAENNPLKAEQYVSNYQRVEMPMGEGVSVLKDSAKVASAFMEEEDTLFSYSGALGQVAGKFNRGDFLAFLAPMKRGKTWWLWYTAETAIHYGHKVLFFTLEMTERQMTRRAWQSLVGGSREEGDIQIPFFEETTETEDGPLKYAIRNRIERRERLDPSQVSEQQKKLRRMIRGGDARIVSLPAYSATVDDLEAHIDNLRHYENFTPDVVVVDYADIVAPSRGFRGDYRHQLDDIWKRLRKMAQQRQTLVVTASQAEKSSFREDVSETHVAEDIRKLAHVTCMLALNQRPEEAKKGVVRISQIAIREGRRVFDQAVVLQCLDIGRTCLGSRLRKDVLIESDDFDKNKGVNKRKRF